MIHGTSAWPVDVDSAAQALQENEQLLFGATVDGDTVVQVVRRLDPPKPAELIQALVNYVRGVDAPEGPESGPGSTVALHAQLMHLARREIIARDAMF